MCDACKKGPWIPTRDYATGVDLKVDVDPSTGVAVDTSTGVAVDPSTGVAVDTSTGVAVDPSTGVAVDPSTGVAVDSVPSDNGATPLQALQRMNAYKQNSQKARSTRAMPYY
jgi:hypothetical protein